MPVAARKHTPKALREQIPSVASIYMGGNIFGNVLGSIKYMRTVDSPAESIIISRYKLPHRAAYLKMTFSE